VFPKAATMRDLSRNFPQTNSRNSYKFFSAFGVNVGLAASVLVFGLIYIYTANGISTTTLKTRQLTAQISQLEAEHKKLELQNSTLQSVSTFGQQSVNFKFVPVTTVFYVKDDNFALR
jgi:cell division protein FtsL